MSRTQVSRERAQLQIPALDKWEYDFRINNWWNNEPQKSQQIDCKIGSETLPWVEQ